MKTLAPRALMIGAATLFAGCGGSQPPIGAPGAMSQSARGAIGSTDDLVYVGSASRAIEVFSYPGLQYKETFSVPAGGAARLCSDSQGDVFAVTAFANANQAYIYEYAHGETTPVQTLDLTYDYVPTGCSSDPTTGDLAVTEYSTNSGSANVAVYQGAQGMPSIYADPDIVAGTQPGYLAIQGRSTKPVKLSKLPELIYRVQVTGSTGTVASIVKLSGWKARNAGACWIQADRVIIPRRDNISLWKYPAGGNALEAVSLKGDQAAGSVAISRGSSL
jgi:hypothetical protein